MNVYQSCLRLVSRHLGLYISDTIKHHSNYKIKNASIPALQDLDAEIATVDEPVPTGPTTPMARVLVSASPLSNGLPALCNQAAEASPTESQLTVPVRALVIRVNNSGSCCMPVT